MKYRFGSLKNRPVVDAKNPLPLIKQRSRREIAVISEMFGGFCCASCLSRSIENQHFRFGQSRMKNEGIHDNRHRHFARLPRHVVTLT